MTRAAGTPWQITRACTGDFFDRHLKSLPAPRLDGPTAADAEVAFQRS
ncbi:hypothetical protein [Streptomyces sp. NBC_01276]